jgi:uncharacterized protein YndB with AHSA1/START domain
MTLPSAKKSASTFRMECSVSITINAPAARVWSLLTNAADFPRWNSTVTSIEGDIALGNKLTLRVPISERAFTPKVTLFESPTLMVWSDGFAPMFKGVRTFTLTPSADGKSTVFDMHEAFAGAMLPMIKGSLPDFGPPFEQYAADLKAEAEKGTEAEKG